MNVRFLVIFSRDLYVLTIKRSRQEFSIDVPKHTSILKIYYNTYKPCINLTPKTSIAFYAQNACGVYTKNRRARLT